MFKLFLLLVLIPQLLYALPKEHLDTNDEMQEIIYDISILKDETAKKTLAEIIKMDNKFSPIKQSFSGGYTRAANWFRIVVQRPADASTQWILSATPAYLNDLRFYSIDKNNHYNMQQAGDLFPSALRPLDKQYGSFSFALTLEDTFPHVYYLRLETRSTSTLNLSIQTPHLAGQQNALNKLAIGLILGSLLLISISTFFMWSTVRHLSFIAFLAYVFISCVGILIVEGTGQQYLLPNQTTFTTYIPQFVMCSILFFINLFFVLFFDTHRNYPYLHVFFRALLIIIPLALLSAPMGFYTDVAPIIITTILLTSLPIQLYVSWKSKNLFIHGSHSIFYGMFIYLICIIITLLTALGSISMSAISIFNIQVSMLVFLIFIGLQQRFRSFQLLKREADIRIEIAEKLTEIERQRSNDKSTFLNLVAHEIKTPLAVIDSATQILEIQPNIDSISHKRHRRIRTSVSHLNHLLDNTFLSERFDESPLQPHIEPFKLNPVIEKILNTRFANKQFNTDIDDNLKCLADPMLFKLALSNLVDNAIKFSPRDSTPELKAQKFNKNNTKGILLSVRNSFTSDIEPDASQWFTKYYQQNNDLHKGLGLGLFMVHKIIMAHKGDLRCKVIPIEHQWQILIQLWLPETRELKQS